MNLTDLFLIPLRGLGLGCSNGCRLRTFGASRCLYKRRNDQVARMMLVVAAGAEHHQICRIIHRNTIWQNAILGNCLLLNMVYFEFRGCC